ncbi:Uncharacterized protein Fot_11250 [Forsythia ovata]|uniref:Uncharacterized protein n=1 Tax=Forsythia ovata TaxID=205694 RepID=A0ABD1WJ53_9LAMI
MRIPVGSEGIGDRDRDEDEKSRPGSSSESTIRSKGQLSHLASWGRGNRQCLISSQIGWVSLLPLLQQKCNLGIIKRRELAGREGAGSWPGVKAPAEGGAVGGGIGNRHTQIETEMGCVCGEGEILRIWE